MSKNQVDWTQVELVAQHDEIDLERVWELIDEEVKLFIKRTPKCADLNKKANKNLINGTPHSWLTHWRQVDPRSDSYLLPHTLFWDHGKNQNAWDADGNKYIDYLLGETPTIWGHCPDDAYTEGLIDCIKNTGMHCMLPSEEAAIAGEMLEKLIGLQYWYVTLSASDADRNAISISRTITGRPNVMMPNLSYMGLNEEGMYWQPIPDGPIMPRWPHYSQTNNDPRVTFSEFNDLESLEDGLKNRDVAIFITEPLLTDGGLLEAEPGYLEGAYKLCQKYGTLFLIDETHTTTSGPGGLYRKLGLKADMWVTGKAIGGGIACGLLGMSTEVGEQYRSKLSDLTVPFGLGSLTGQGTTMSGNILSIRGLRLALEHYYTDETYGKMIGAMDHLCAGLSGVIEKRKAPFSVTQSGARSHINCLPKKPTTAYEAMLGSGWGGYHEYFTLCAVNRGFIPNPWFNMLLTTPYHTEEDNNKFVTMFDECVANMMG